MVRKSRYLEYWLIKKLQVHLTQILLPLLLCMAMLISICPAAQAGSATNVYVRADGSDTACNGLVDLAYSGSGTGQPCAFRTISRALIEIAPGGEIAVGAGEYPAGVQVQIPVMIKLSQGTIITGNAPCFDLQANDIFLFGGQCLPIGNNDGVVIAHTLENLVIIGMTIDGSNQSSGNGIQFGGSLPISITTFQILANTFRQLAGSGIEIGGNVTLSGDLYLDNNLFQGNAGAGITNLTGRELDARYNNWNDMSGPTGPSGDGVVGLVNFTYWTYAAIRFETLALPEDKVNVDQSIAYTVILDASELRGMDIFINYDPAILTVESLSDFSSEFSPCASTLARIFEPGSIEVCGDRFTQPPVDGTFTLFKVSFKGNSGGLSSLQVNSTDPKFTASGGTLSKILPSVLEKRTIEVLSSWPITAAVNLQGRSNENGAVITLGVGQLFGAGPVTFPSTNSSGSTMVSDVFPDTYQITVGMPLYLDVIASSNRFVTLGAGKTNITSLFMLAGDANDDNIIDVVDAVAVANRNKALCTAGSNCPDFDLNGTINVLDLVFVGNNYGKTSATAYESWTP